MIEDAIQSSLDYDVEAPNHHLISSSEHFFFCLSGRNEMFFKGHCCDLFKVESVLGGYITS